MTTASARMPLVIGFTSVALMLGGLGTWSVATKIAGAVHAPGTVRVESDRQVVEHPDGGVVGEIRARDGDQVAAGDVLLRLDSAFLISELSIVEGQLAELFARRARLAAERDGAEAPNFHDPPALSEASRAALDEQIAGQRNLFDARLASLAQERRQLAEQQTQVRRQIEGVEAQLAALERQRILIADELADVRALFERGLIQSGRLLTLEREEARLAGEIGGLTARSAEAEARIAAIDIESLKLVDRRREEAIARLRDLRFTQIELEERRLSLIERIARLDVRAPVSGVIFDSRVSALKSVVRAAEPMMYVVPGDQPLEIAARIDPIDIDQVFPGQHVALMLTTFNRGTTPEVPGRVLRVSADAELDETTGVSFYQAVLRPDPDALAALRDVTLLPGMPVEAFLKTEDRSPLSYLLQPLTIYLNRAFREE